MKILGLLMMRQYEQQKHIEMCQGSTGEVCQVRVGIEGLNAKLTFTMCHNTRTTGK